MKNQEEIYQNFVKRVPMLNYSAFNLVYRDMCDNTEISIIHLDACAMSIDPEGNKYMSPWVPAALVPFVKADAEIWTVTLSITPSAVRYLTVNSCIEFECRIQGKSTVIHVPFTSMLTVRGMRGMGNVVDVQDFHCLVDTAPQTETVKPIRPTLQVVK